VPDAAVGTMGRGVLRPDLAATHLRLDRHKPSDALAPFVDYYWIVRWDLRGQPPYEADGPASTPNVNLAFEASGAGIFGVTGVCSPGHCRAWPGVRDTVHGRRLPAVLGRRRSPS